MTDVKPAQNKTAHAPEPVKKATETAKDVAEKGRKGGSTVMMSAAAGSVAGAVLGGLAGAALADQNTRKTFGEQLGKMARTAGDTMKKLDENQDQIKEGVNKTAGALKDTSEPLQKTATKKS